MGCVPKYYELLTANNLYNTIHKRDPLSFVSTIGELLEREGSGSIQKATLVCYYTRRVSSVKTVLKCIKINKSWITTKLYVIRKRERERERMLGGG
jgi:hypothetical protein